MFYLDGLYLSFQLYETGEESSPDTMNDLGRDFFAKIKLPIDRRLENV